MTKGKKINDVVRVFSTGAIRDKNDQKPDYAGFLSPLAVKRYGEYMHKHRHLASGDMRSSRNWRKGMPIETFEESMVRHTVDVWLHLDGYSEETVESLEDALCGVMFNAQGLLHETLLKRKSLSRGRVD